MRLRDLLVMVLVVLAVAAVAAGEREETLWEAARQGDLQTIKRLKAEGVDLDARTNYNASALAFACSKGHLDVARYLLDNGADVNAKDTFYGFTPIGFTFFRDHPKVTLLLLEKGADGVDQVLMNGVQKGNLKLIHAALEHPDMESDIVEAAIKVGQEVDGGEAVLELLRAAEVRKSVHTEIPVDAEVMQSYAGTYKHSSSDATFEFRVEDGKLVGQTAGKPPLKLMAYAENRFETAGDNPTRVTFGGRGGVSERVVVDDGSESGDQQYGRVDAVADAAGGEAATEDSAEAKPGVMAEERKIARSAAQNWSSFRGGPTATGVADGQGAPTDWDVESGRNIQWKTAIPGLANSSPVIWGDHIFVTTAISGTGDDTFRSGLYGDVESVDDESQHVFKVYALDKTSGEVLWEKTAATAKPEVKRHTKSTQANSTPATDGKHVVALFGSVGVLSGYDAKTGKHLWTTDVGVMDSGWFYDKSYQWGQASSPVIYKKFVILQVDLQKDSFIAAYNLSDGKLAWKTDRDEIPTWGSPSIYTGKSGDEVITNGTKIRGYDPQTGKELWTLGPNSEVTVATPVISEGLIYVTAGYPPVRPIYVVKPGSRGDLSLPDGEESSDAIAWSRNRGGTYMPTPVVYEDYLYTCANNGRLTCYKAKTGEVVYRQRINDSGAFSASPIAADGRLYFSTEDGDVIVVRSGPKYEELARHSMGDVIMATPAISDGLMVVRTLRHLVGISEGDGAAE